MSDKRKTLSGAQYRKRALKKAERHQIVADKTLKLNRFFESIVKKTLSSSTENNPLIRYS